MASDKTPTNEILLDIKKEMEELNFQLQRQNSFRRRLASSLMSGVATAIGATIIAGILIIIFTKVIQSAENIPILDDIIEYLQLKEVIQSS